MTKFLLVLTLIVSRSTFGQSNIDTLNQSLSLKYLTPQTDSLNRVYFEKLKSSGEFDANGVKTGLWVQYKLLSDSADTVYPVTVEANDTAFSANLRFPKSTMLEKIEGHYKDGLTTGKWKWLKAAYYSKDDVIWEINCETEFMNGEKNGKHRRFSFGNIYYEATYAHDQLDGIELIYINGYLALKGFYKKDLRQTGIWYYENGSTKMTKNFKKDPVVNVIEYYENGRIKSKYHETGDEGMYQGIYRTYDERGRLIKKILYKDGIEVRK